MKKLLAILFLLSGSALAQSLSGVNGDCMVGGAQALTSGLPSTATQQIGTTNVIPGAGVQGSYPSCLVSVYATGTTAKAAIWADNSGTPAPLANPFTANGDGSFTFFTGAGCYDIVMSSGIAPLMPYPRTLTDFCIGQGATGVGGTGTPPSMAVWVGPTQLGNSTITDDLVNPPASPNGLNFVQSAAFYTAPNCNPGTLQFHLAQISGACVALNTQTTNILGIAGPGSGDVGNVSVATNLTYPCVFDNQTTPGDWAVAGTPADECDDAGATRPTTGVQILGHIASTNSGAGTTALVVQNTGDTVQAGASSGNLLNCATSGALWFAATADTTGTCDAFALTDGAGNETATSITLTGTGAGFLELVQGAAPTVTDANAAYFAAGNSIPTSFLTVVPSAPPTTTGCLQGSNSGGIVTLAYTASSCGSGAGSVTSVGLTVNSTSPSGIFTVTGSPVTGAGTLNFNLAGTSGGIPYFSSSTVLTTSGALTNHAIVLGGGAAASPVVVSSLGTTTTVLHGNAAGDPSFGAVVGGDMTNNTVTSTQMAVVNTRRVCAIIIGADNGSSALVDADIAPQGRQCFVPAASTVVEVDVAADGGTPNVVVRKNHAGSGTNLVSSALATAGSGGIACSNTGGTTGIDGATTCSGTLQNTSLSAGDYIETTTATAGGVAKRMSIFVTFTIN